MPVMLLVVNFWQRWFCDIRITGPTWAWGKYLLQDQPGLELLTKKRFNAVSRGLI